jgi:hypothetical protein
VIIAYRAVNTLMTSKARMLFEFLSVIFIKLSKSTFAS